MKNETSTGNGACNIIGNTLKKREKNQETDIINKNVSGIYHIVNKLNGNRYVGSSLNILGTSGRFYNHIRMLKSKTHHCEHLQNAWNKYGPDNFEFIIVENVPPSKLIDAEQRYLDEARVFPDKYYNMSYDASSITMTQKIKNKISISQKKRLQNKSNHGMFGKRHSKESIDKIKRLSPRVGILNGMFGVHRFGSSNPNYGNGKSIIGKKNPNFDNSIYTFINKKNW